MGSEKGGKRGGELLRDREPERPVRARDEIAFGSPEWLRDELSTFHDGQTVLRLLQALREDGFDLNRIVD